VADLEFSREGPMTPKGSKIEAERAKVGGFLRRGSLSPPAINLGERCKLLQRSPGPSPGNWRVFLQFQLSGWRFWTIWMKCFCCARTISVFDRIVCVLTVVISDDRLCGPRGHGSPCPWIHQCSETPGRCQRYTTLGMLCAFTYQSGTVRTRI